MKFAICQELFEDTSWELLLEIFVACEEAGYVSEADLIDALGAPRSIVRRWLTVFEDCGYIKFLQNQGSSMMTITDIARGVWSRSNVAIRKSAITAVEHR